MSNFPIQTRRAEYVSKTWGREVWFANHEEANYCGKILYIRDGCKFSMHFHRDKHETFFVLTGRVILRVVDYATGHTHATTLVTGDSCEIPRETPHQLEAVDGDATILEASTFHRDADSYRLWR